MANASDQIAAFIANRGVTRVQEGERTYSERQMYRARRGEKPKTEQDLIDERRYVTGADGVEHCCNGLGEWIY